VHTFAQNGFGRAAIGTGLKFGRQLGLHKCVLVTEVYFILKRLRSARPMRNSADTETAL
jgi:hypothetical protein